MTTICTSSSFITLERDNSVDINVRPRWPHKNVALSRAALLSIQNAQKELPPGISLVITRGYELERPYIKYGRKFGGLIFKFIYPNRCYEVKEIFTCNGHSISGEHLDVSISYHGKILNFLPFNVFTPVWLAKKLSDKYRDIIFIVNNALVNSGFQIHENMIEALQIHIDLK